MRKIYNTPEKALEDLLYDGMTIAAGGFGLCGIPEILIKAIRDAGTKNLTVASNNAGLDDFGLGILLQTKQVKKMQTTGNCNMKALSKAKLHYVCNQQHSPESYKEITLEWCKVCEAIFSEVPEILQVIKKKQANLEKNYD